jgi:hypothetical protein
VTFHTLVRGLRVDRLNRSRGITGQRLEPGAIEAVADGGVGSMRVLEAIIALTSIATAILIGLGR